MLKKIASIQDEIAKLKKITELETSRIGRKPLDLTGQVFVRLTVRELVGLDKYGRRTWLCDCECGNQCLVSTNSLRSGLIMSCGCLRKDLLSGKVSSRGALDEKKDIKRIWYGMMYKCYGPLAGQSKRSKAVRDRYEKPKRSSSPMLHKKWNISVCEEWHKFENFLMWSLKNGYSASNTLCRRDAYDDYNPENCFWGPRHSTGESLGRATFTANGHSWPLTKWARELGISLGALQYRLEKCGGSMQSVLDRSWPKGRNIQASDGQSPIN